MSVINEINAVTSSLKGIERHYRITDEYLDILRGLSSFELIDLDNDLSMAMKTILRIRKDLDSIKKEKSTMRLERYLDEQISDQKGRAL